MKKQYFLCVCLFLALFSCSESSTREFGGKELNVDLDETIKPFDEIFSKAEIIPLETTDSSLIIWMNKVIPVGDELYIHDDWSNNLRVFNKSGKYKHKISRRGQGAGEYLNMNDCVVDASNDDIYLLSLYGVIKRYSLSGVYKNDINLPARPHYYSMVLLDEKNMATWSCLEKELGSVLLLDRVTGDTLGSFWHDDRIFNHQQPAPFHQYEGKTYFATALRQQVYELCDKGLQLSYSWNFGKYNIRESTLQYYLNIEKPSERNDKIIDDYGSESLPFILYRQRQNKSYYYVGLQRKSGMRPPMTHVFYDKRNHKSLVFDYLGESCRMNSPLYFGEDFILTDVLYDNRENFKSILSDSEYAKLENMKEDDNPCLLKLYFKK